MGIFDFLKKTIEGSLQEKQAKQERLIRWQRLVMRDSPDRLVLTEQQLKAMTIQQAENDLRIVKDCAKLVEETVKPDVFFERLNLMVDKAKHLAALEEYISFSGASPTAAYNEIVDNHQEAIRYFLIRYLSETFDKAQNMKTEKGRIGKYQKFYDSLQNYYCYMNDENIAYIERKYKAFTQRKG